MRMSISCDSVPTAKSVSTKPWFLTFSEETRDVFVWKNGMRLQVNGQSVGGVVNACVCRARDGTITVSMALSYYAHTVHSLLLPVV